MLVVAAEGTLAAHPKRRAPQELPLIVDGKAVCRQCGGPVEGKEVFCQKKKPKCRRQFSRDKAVVLQQTAVADAFDAGVKHQAQQQLQDLPALPLPDEHPVEHPRQRHVSLGWDDLDFCVRFNDQLLDREVDGWNKSTRTLPMALPRAVHPLLQPLLAVSRLERDSEGYILYDKQRVTTTLKVGNGRLKAHLAGFDGYDSSQHEGDAASRDAAQRRHITAFLPWVAWTGGFPGPLLPPGFDDSATWAAAMQDMLLGAVHKVFSKNSIYYDPTWEILYMHVLDQSVGATRFRMHRDVEEDSNRMGKNFRLRVQHTVVLLLEKGQQGRVPSMYVAGAPKNATYLKDMTGHVFHAGLFHTTEGMKEGQCSGVKLGVFIGNRF